MALQAGLSGFVFNDSRGVTVEVQGREEKINIFLEGLNGKDKPAAAEIVEISVSDIAVRGKEKEFIIRKSDRFGEPTSQVCADIAVCNDCLAEMREKNDYRYRYPFINCTNCGPRYSIVKTIPYDRCNTTMSAFEMCGKCAAEYDDVTDRRFHAQPVACGVCGPKIWLTDNKGKTIEADSDRAIAKTAKMLLAGKIAAIKGLGGFHLAADALNEKAVALLRQRKRRDHKPFALMTDSIEKIRRYATVSEQAEKILKSPDSPIVLLPKRKGNGIVPSVAEGVGTFGFMLCYAPLHWLLFEEGLEVLVMTSGNISDEPLICENVKAMERLGGVADIFLMHNRDIYRQVDDSIVHFVNREPVVLRRSRGYVPTPLITEKPTEVQIFAAGADMKNTFCFAKGNQLIVSEHIGDLEDAEVFGHYKKSIEHLRGLFEVEPKVIACDLHPGYLSTQYALSRPGVKKIRVQHHWAHIASVLAENNIEGPVIGLAVDGTGYGADGAIWGCECLIASLEKFERFGHLDYYKLAGADMASKEAIRSVTGLLKFAYGDDFDLQDLEWLLKRIEPDKKVRKVIAEQIQKGVNTVETSSMGRVYDAVAAMAGLGNYNNFEAQLPMALEAIAAGDVEERYDYDLIAKNGEPIRIDLRKMIRQIITDIENKLDESVISAKFHNCICESLLDMAEKARESTRLTTAVL